MRIAVMGTGGVGGYFGARLAGGGQDVSFVARGRQLDALRRNGLRVQSPLGDVHLPDVVATDDPADLDPVDVVLFGVKLWDTEQAAAQLKPVLGEGAAVVSFQNGVVKDDLLRRAARPGPRAGRRVLHLGGDRRTGGRSPATAGRCRSSCSASSTGSTTPRVAALHDACARSGIDVEVSATIERTIWEKFVFLVGLSGTTSLARTPIGPIRENPRSRAFLHDVMDEVVQVARAQGVSLPVDYARDRLSFVDTVPAAMTSSMHHDLEREGRLEVAWLSGDVVARGAEAGVATPANRAVADLLAVHADGADR